MKKCACVGDYCKYWQYARWQTENNLGYLGMPTRSDPTVTADVTSSDLWSQTTRHWKKLFIWPPPVVSCSCLLLPVRYEPHFYCIPCLFGSARCTSLTQFWIFCLVLLPAIIWTQLFLFTQQKPQMKVYNIKSQVLWKGKAFLFSNILHHGTL